MHVLLQILLAIVTSARGAVHRVHDGWVLHTTARQMPDVEHPELVDTLVDAAIRLQTPRVPAALIVALAWAEARFDPMAKPACGVMQVYPKDLDEPQTSCARWRNDLEAGVAAGVREIEVMLADKRVHGNLRNALLYRACGNSAFDGTCDDKKYVWVTNAINLWQVIEPRHAKTLFGS
jgi:hypothetical protein